ncbi:MAG: hypothetical protein ACI89Z_001448, partial [Porticoccus sp.]
WLSENGFNISIASRSLLNESEQQSVEGHQSILKAHGINIDLENKLVIFPEMKSDKDVPEISVNCWNILGVAPDDQMCSKERMIVKRKEDEHAIVMPCTLLAYDEKLILGNTLKTAKKEVFLNHRFCAEFCVLGGASCSGTK